jgi:hypothetical protein
MRRVVPTLLATLSLAATATVATGATGLAAGAAPDATATATAGAAAGAAQPTKVVIILVDALSQQVVRRYDMDHVQALMYRGTDFPNAYLGHMGAETVVTHNVLTTGALPKHMGWTDEYVRDVDGVITPDVDEGEDTDNPYWLTGSLSSDQMFALQENAGYPHLADYLHDARPGSTVATVSPKTYAAWGMGGAGSDMIVTFSSRNYDCDGDGTADLTWRGPDGVNVPTYLSDPECGRFYVESSSDLTYDTDMPPAWMYPLDGNRYTVGRDPEHQGGDVWATDAALSIMRHETDWSGVFLSLPGVDKAAHMWGSIDDPGGPVPMTHMRRATAVADQQVGRVMRYLRRSGQLDDTLVVLTADHGQQPSRSFYGENGPGQGDYNWYWGDAANGDYLDPSPELHPLIATGNVSVTYQDGAIRTWTTDRTAETKNETAAVMEGLPGVTAVYVRRGDHYAKVSSLGRAGMGPREWAWFRAHAKELVNTEAAPYGPEVIGLLRDFTSYGVAGDHGGINRTVQRIPITFAGAGTAATDRHAAIRSVDVVPTVLRAMGIDETHPTDGRAYRLR